MKRFILTVSLALFGYIIISCDPSGHTGNDDHDSAQAIVEDVQYDSLLAQKYGPDDYGMKKYVMAFLRRGPNPSKDSETAAQLQKAHLQNIERMAEEGKLALAGPFFGNGEIRGIYVFNVQSIGEAEDLTNSDPAIQAGALKMELIEWYGPAGLLALNDIHKKLTKKSVIE